MSLKTPIDTAGKGGDSTKASTKVHALGPGAQLGKLHRGEDHDSSAARQHGVYHLDGGQHRQAARPARPGAVARAGAAAGTMQAQLGGRGAAATQSPGHAGIRAAQRLVTAAVAAGVLAPAGRGARLCQLRQQLPATAAKLGGSRMAVLAGPTRRCAARGGSGILSSGGAACLSKHPARTGRRIGVCVSQHAGLAERRRVAKVWGGHAERGDACAGGLWSLRCARPRRTRPSSLRQGRPVRLHTLPVPGCSGARARRGERRPRAAKP